MPKALITIQAIALTFTSIVCADCFRFDVESSRLVEVVNTNLCKISSDEKVVFTQARTFTHLLTASNSTLMVASGKISGNKTAVTGEFFNIINENSYNRLLKGIDADLSIPDVSDMLGKYSIPTNFSYGESSCRTVWKVCIEKDDFITPAIICCDFSVTIVDAEEFEEIFQTKLKSFSIWSAAKISKKLKSKVPIRLEVHRDLNIDSKSSQE